MADAVLTRYEEVRGDDGTVEEVSLSFQADDRDVTITAAGAGDGVARITTINDHATTCFEREAFAIVRAGIEELHDRGYEADLGPLTLADTDDGTDEAGGRDDDGHVLDHDDPADLRQAYEAEDSLTAVADHFAAGYDTVYQRLVDNGIHLPNAEEKRETALSLLDEHGGEARQAEIREAAGWSRTTARSVFKHLTDRGDIEKETVGRENVIRLPDHEPGSVDDTGENDGAGVESNGQPDPSVLARLDLDSDDVVDALDGAQTVHQVQRELHPIDREDVRALLGELGLLDAVATGTSGVDRATAEAAVQEVDDAE